MNFDKYINKMDYPIRPSRPSIVPHPNDYDISIYQTRLARFQEDFKKFEDLMAQYTKEEKEIHLTFWKDAFEELGIPFDHPKAGKMKGFAWENGHPNGFSSVYFYLSEIWDIVQD